MYVKTCEQFKNKIREENNHKQVKQRAQNQHSAHILANTTHAFL